ncbi:CLUMA_CG002830, isoform A [Clunio marinus]|uniref:CLUMA_CG002830, isoform A n=1 Tax=Clunio marinus TaxID=568069 RepID=A0A1J1HRP9_9DIPT|nr:CLUMA_CG002830, isoform A [Clunio marinus]
MISFRKRLMISSIISGSFEHVHVSAVFQTIQTLLMDSAKWKVLLIFSQVDLKLSIANQTIKCEKEKSTTLIAMKCNFFPRDFKEAKKKTLQIFEN